MKLKKLLCMTLATTMLLTVTACGNNDSKDKKDSNNTTKENQSTIDTSDVSQYFTISISGVDRTFPAPEILGNSDGIYTFSYNSDYDADPNINTYRCEHCADPDYQEYATIGFTFLEELEDGQVVKFHTLTTGSMYFDPTTMSESVDPNDDGVVNADIYACNHIKLVGGVGYGSTPEEIVAAFGEPNQKDEKEKEGVIKVNSYYYSFDNGKDHISYDFFFNTHNGVAQCYKILIDYNNY